MNRTVTSLVVVLPEQAHPPIILRIGVNALDVAQEAPINAMETRRRIKIEYVEPLAHGQKQLLVGGIRALRQTSFQRRRRTIVALAEARSLTERGDGRGCQDDDREQADPKG